jgi:hypothetical protein
MKEACDLRAEVRVGWAGRENQQRKRDSQADGGNSSKHILQNYCILKTFIEVQFTYTKSTSILNYIVMHFDKRMHLGHLSKVLHLSITSRTSITNS